MVRNNYDLAVALFLKKGCKSEYVGEPKAKSKPQSFTIPKPNGGKAFEVVGIPLQSPGLYIVELSSPRLGAALLGKPQPLYVPTAALVTNLAVHLKWSAENALAFSKKEKLTIQNEKIAALIKIHFVKTNVPIGDKLTVLEYLQMTVLWMARQKD